MLTNLEDSNPLSSERRTLGPGRRDARIDGIMYIRTTFYTAVIINITSCFRAHRAQDSPTPHISPARGNITARLPTALCPGADDFSVGDLRHKSNPKGAARSARMTTQAAWLDSIRYYKVL